MDVLDAMTIWAWFTAGVLVGSLVVSVWAVIVLRRLGNLCRELMKELESKSNSKVE